MATNTNEPHGLRAVRHLYGGTIRTVEYPMATDTSIYTGDPVTMAQDEIILATAGARILGVFNGCRFKRSNGEFVYQTYWASGANAGSSEETAFLYVDPGIVYEIQADEDTTPLPTTGARNLNADILYTAGSTLTGQSGVELDASTLTTGAAQLRIVDLHNIPDNLFGAFAKVEVIINEHNFGATGITGLT